MKSKTNKLRKEVLEHYKYALKLKKAIDKRNKAMFKWYNDYENK